MVSPLLANIYLHALDRAWEKRASKLGVLVRYADDLVVVCYERWKAEAALAELRALLADLGLELAEAKTRLVHRNEDGEGFDFLGFHHRMVESRRKPGRWFLARRPSAQAVRAAHDRIRVITDRRRLLLPPEDVVADLNRFLRGWGGYFRYGNSSECFDNIDNYTFDRVARFLGQKHQRERPLNQGRALLAKRRDLIPHKLVGTVGWKPIPYKPVHATR